jgi:hypothetical protein
MLRATIGLALKRARLENVYNALRGRDAKTGIDNPEKRDEQFQKMQAGQAAALNLANWHHFLSALTLAGYRGEKMISSETAIIYSYVLYLVGIVDYGIDKKSMRQAIAEFFFMAALTGRYTNSPETRFESDLALVRDLPDGAAYLGKLARARLSSKTARCNDFSFVVEMPLPNFRAAQSPNMSNSDLGRFLAKRCPSKLADTSDTQLAGGALVIAEFGDEGAQVQYLRADQRTSNQRIAICNKWS